MNLLLFDNTLLDVGASYSSLHEFCWENLLTCISASWSSSEVNSRILQSSAGFWSTLLFFSSSIVSRNSEPLHQKFELTISFTVNPLVILSGYLVETYLHREGSLYVWISPTWFNTKYLSSPPSLWIQYKAFILSVHLQLILRHLQLILLN